MEIIKFIKDYWVIISFCVTELIALFVFVKIVLKVMKCSLRNDMLDIWDKCKPTKQITSYQLQAFEYSYDLYKKLKGNSFIDEIKERIEKFEIID